MVTPTEKWYREVLNSTTVYYRQKGKFRGYRLHFINPKVRLLGCVCKITVKIVRIVCCISHFVAPTKKTVEREKSTTHFTALNKTSRKGKFDPSTISIDA